MDFPIHEDGSNLPLQVELPVPTAFPAIDFSLLFPDGFGPIDDITTDEAFIDAVAANS
jgi:hypothetical protein